MPQCKAHLKNGNQCRRSAINGGAVCIMHGGKAPQVQASAKLRLLALVDPALAELERLLQNSKQDPVRMAAVRDILDRTGFKPTDKVQIDQRREPSEGEVTLSQVCTIEELEDLYRRMTAKMEEKSLRKMECEQANIQRTQCVPERGITQ